MAKQDIVAAAKLEGTSRDGSNPPDRRDCVRVGQPGIVYFAAGDRFGKPAPAQVWIVGGRRTLGLFVMTPGGLRLETGSRHVSDPEFDTGSEAAATLSSWAFFDEV